MAQLYGRAMTRRDLAEHAGALSQFAGVRLMMLGDGVERGIRMLEFRTGAGLRFSVLLDRALDIADCEYKGAAIGRIRRPASDIPGCTNTKAKAGSASCGRSPACSSPAASTTS